MSELVLRWQRIKWECPECGPVLDRSLEVFVDKRRLGRWTEDGHQGKALALHRIETEVVQALGLPFEWQEQLRSARAQQGCSEALDPLFLSRLKQQGHTTRQSVQVFDSPDECAPL